MADRLRARGDSLGELVELLANIKIDNDDEKAKHKAKHQRPIRPPPNMVRKGEKREVKKR